MRRGMIIPIVLICLIVMATLGVVLMSASTSEYSQSAHVAYGLRAREVALAALEEANAVIYDHLNAPGPRDPDWHQELFNQAKNRAENDRGVLFQQDLKPLLPRTQEVATGAGGTLVSANVEFLGFKPLRYDSQELFKDPGVYWSSVPQLDAAPPPPPREYTGYYRVKVVASFKGVSRTFSDMHDVKIVTVTPPAREFALFSNMPTVDPSGNGNPDYVNNDLNRGGRFRVYPHGKARIFVRGPLVAETEGWPGGDGNGDGEPDDTLAGYSGDDWHGWRAVPATRDGIMPRIMVVASMGPRRPESTGDSRWFLGAIAHLPGLGSLGASLGDDPGYYILNGQQWYCETQPRHGRSFSILGDADGGNREVYRGLLTKLSANDRAVIGNADGLTNPDGSYFAEPPGDEDRWVVEPEGGLLGKYNLVKYNYEKWGPWPVDDLYEGYDLRKIGETVTRYGMHWEKKYVQSFWNSFFTTLFQAGSFVLMGATGGLFSLPILSTVIGPAIVFVNPVALGTLGAAIASNPTSPQAMAALQNINAQTAPKAFPPGYRFVRRSMTRYYPFKKLEDFASVQDGSAQMPLRLDGILGFEKLNSTRSFFYTGAGFLYSDQQAAPTISGPLLPTDANKDYLTVFYDGPIDNAQEQAFPLNVQPAPGIPDTGLMASVYANQGIKTSGKITINGNYTCGLINKSKNADDTSIKVDYRFSRLLQDPAEYDSGKWHVSAVSHRTCQVIDR